MTAQTLPASTPPDTAPDSRVITILSPKGGAGKTTVATNLAVGLAKRYPRQVALVDVDLQFGDVAGALRLSPQATFVDVARRWPLDSATLKLQLTPHHSGLYSLCAPVNPVEADEIGAAHVYGVLQELRRSFPFVVVDTDPGLSERVLSALDCSTDIVMVCSSEVPSIRGLRKALDALDLIGLAAGGRHFVLNRADAKINISADEIETSIGHAINIQVPSSRDVVVSTNEGVPVMESGNNPVIVKAFELLCDRFELESASTADRAKSGLFRRRG